MTARSFVSLILLALGACSSDPDTALVQKGDIYVSPDMSGVADIGGNYSDGGLALDLVLLDEYFQDDSPSNELASLQELSPVSDEGVVSDTGEDSEDAVGELPTETEPDLETQADLESPNDIASSADFVSSTDPGPSADLEGPAEVNTQEDTSTAADVSSAPDSEISQPDPCAGISNKCSKDTPTHCVVNYFISECLQDSDGCYREHVTSCDDGMACTTDRCDAATVSCTHEMNCTHNSACMTNFCGADGSCVSEPTPYPDDGDPCTETVCSDTDGFSYVPLYAFCITWHDENPDACNGASLQDFFGEVAAALPSGQIIPNIYYLGVHFENPDTTGRILVANGFREWALAISTGTAPVAYFPTPFTGYYTNPIPDGFEAFLGLGSPVVTHESGIRVLTTNTPPCDLVDIHANTGANLGEHVVNANPYGSTGDYIMFYEPF